VPAQAGLRPFEHEELKQDPVVVLGYTPFFIVIADGQRIPCPSATNQRSAVLAHDLFGKSWELRAAGRCASAMLAPGSKLKARSPEDARAKSEIAPALLQ